MDWLWLVGGALTTSIPWMNYGGKQGADVNAMRALEDEVTKGAGVHTPKDPAP